MDTVLFAAAGLLVGALIIYFILNTRIVALRLKSAELAPLAAKVDLLENEKLQLYGQTRADAASIQTLKTQIQSLDEDKKNLDANLKKILTEITNESFVRQSQLLNDQQSARLSDILNPLKEKIKDFETKVNASQTESKTTNAVLMEQIKNLTSLNQTVTQKTEDLTNALRGSNKAQGGWGEMILERVLERSGLKKGSEYETQFVTQNINGQSIRPDAIIFLPEQKNIIIDSKVSLNAYEQYANTDDANIKGMALKAHLLSVKSHIKLLAEKNYYSGMGLNSPEFTLMFIPIESGFALSVQEDTSLFEYAWDKKIVLVSPSTLLATLRTIASVWKNENQTRNAIEIAQKAGDMYDKFVAFTEDMDNVGKAIERADDAYGKAMNKLSVGKGNLIQRAKNLQKLGINSSKNLSAKLMDDDTE
ncbi:MAG: DNA recombination protein RmuC [Bacteroidota bacterium]